MISHRLSEAVSLRLSCARRQERWKAEPKKKKKREKTPAAQASLWLFHFAIPNSFLPVAPASPVFPECQLIPVTNICPEFLQVISTTGYQQEAGTHRHFR